MFQEDAKTSSLDELDDELLESQDTFLTIDDETKTPRSFISESSRGIFTSSNSKGVLNRSQSLNIDANRTSPVTDEKAEVTSGTARKKFWKRGKSVDAPSSPGAANMEGKSSKADHHDAKVGLVPTNIFIHFINQSQISSHDL